jgi:electron transport complex protein RnfC
MELKTFDGGLHPPGLKNTAGCAIVTLPPPAKVVLPVSQHIGAPAKPVVTVGDQVKRGQIIAEAGGFVSAPIHATISGKVQAVGNFLHPMGVPSPAIVIERNPDDPEPEFSPLSDGFTLTPDEIKKKVGQAGVVGMGGAAFPTLVKLSPPASKPIDTLLLNGVECEPALTSDHRLMLEHPDKILLGMQLLMRVLGAKQGIIGIEANKPDAIELFLKKTKDLKNISVCPLQVQYPQGGEKQLIFAALGREVPSGGLPMDVGVVVQNVATTAAVYDAVTLSMPLMDRVVTLAGNCVKNPGNYLVRIGTLISTFIEATGGLKENVPLKKVISGGPMMGPAVFDLNVPILKGTSGILCWDAEEAQEYEPGVCIRCGRCIQGCPIRLMPQKLKNLIDANKWVETDQSGIMDCMECGCCSYICPAKLSLVQTFKLGKKIVAGIRKREADEAKARKEGGK